MKYKSIVLLLLVLVSMEFCLPALTRAASDDRALNLGCVAYAKEASAKAYRQIGEYLEKELGRQVAVTVYPNYHEVIHDIANEKLDVAILSPLVYVCAAEAVDLSVLGHGVYRVSGDYAYRSTIFVHSDSSVSSLAELSGKEIAFVDELSASGFIVPKVALMKEKVTNLKERFAGNHVDAFQKLLSGDVEAAATLNTIMDDEPSLAQFKEKVKVIWTSDFVIPSDAFVATSKVPFEVQEKMTNLLLKYGEAQKSDRADQNGIFSSFVPEDEKLYEGLQQLVNEYAK